MIDPRPGWPIDRAHPAPTDHVISTSPLPRTALPPESPQPSPKPPSRAAVEAGRAAPSPRFYEDASAIQARILASFGKP